MSRSEARAFEAIDRGLAVGMTEREAAIWRQAVTDPCGCIEGLGLGMLIALAGRNRALGGHRGRGTVLGFLAGAAVGKVIGVTRGLPLVKYQRAELDRRVAELRTAAPSS